MKKSALIIFVIVIISAPFSFLFADSDWEYWNHYKTSIDLKKNMKILLEPEFRFKDGLNNYYTYIDLGLNWKIRKWVSLSVNYRHIFKKQGDGWNQEYRPHLNLKFIKNLNKYSLSSRSRIELRIKNEESSFRYRNKTSFTLPTMTLLHILPNIAEEIFYDFPSKKINKNRIYAGVDFPFNKKFCGAIYYILESNRKENIWLNTNILKIDVKCNF